MAGTPVPRTSEARPASISSGSSWPPDACTSSTPIRSAAPVMTMLAMSMPTDPQMIATIRAFRAASSNPCRTRAQVKRVSARNAATITSPPSPYNALSPGGYRKAARQYTRTSNGTKKNQPRRQVSPRSGSASRGSPSRADFLASKSTSRYRLR